MSDWRNELQPASFRGVPFEYLSASSPAGRRTQIHEFVQRDKPEVEDLGRVTRPFTVTAFVGGDDCLDKRDALEQAVDVPGAGELILPTRGAMQATCTSCTCSDARNELGLIRFELVFVESGDKGYPIATPATDAQTGIAADSIMDSGANWFTESMAAVDTARVNINAMRSSVSAAYGALSNTIGTITQTVANAGDLVDMVLNAPANFLAAIKAGVGSVRSSIQGMNPTSALNNLRSVAGSSKTMGSVSSAGGPDTVAAVTAINELVRHAQLAIAVESAAQLPLVRPASKLVVTPTIWQQSQQTAEPEPILFMPDVLAARDLIDSALWDAQQGGGGRPPIEVFTVLQDARITVRRQMTKAASGAIPLVNLKPTVMQPALVLAYKQWGDATRTAEIVQRNRISHPGFVPPIDLQVARD